jgi:hypothetical protein
MTVQKKEFDEIKQIDDSPLRSDPSGFAQQVWYLGFVPSALHPNSSLRSDFSTRQPLAEIPP